MQSALIPLWAEYKHVEAVEVNEVVNGGEVVVEDIAAASTSPAQTIAVAAVTVTENMATKRVCPLAQQSA